MAQLTRRFHIPSALRRSPLRIEPEQARELLAGGAQLIDVRRQDDGTTPLPDALRLAPDMVPGRLAGLRKEVAIVLACT